MEALVKVATCNLDQWALDFDTNLGNIIESIIIAKRENATIRLGPELEVSGYGCEDHFLEQDTFFHAWESLEKILGSDLTDGILCNIGMPIIHQNVRYNCQVYCLNRKILLIRPKMFLANDGNYRETRWFTAWSRIHDIDEHVLPKAIRDVTGQNTVPFGLAVIEFNDAVVATETCEELFTPDSPHIELALNGVEIILNGSGSHHSLRKLNTRLDLIKNATSKAGGAYLYANQQGCDGGRLYYDGCSLIALNGNVLAQGSQFSVRDVEVITAVIDLEEIRSYRGAISSRGVQASSTRSYHRIRVDFNLCNKFDLSPTEPMESIRQLKVEEEIAYGPSCWLWDYLRRSGASGYFLPLSGGADSSATAAMVGIMCKLVVEEIKKGDKRVLEDVQKVVKDKSYFPKDSQELASRILHTTYMGSKNSSEDTRKRAENLAKEIGAYHLELRIDTVFDAIVSVFSLVTGKIPKFKVFGGTYAENLALQNIQARIRMVFAFLFAQLIPWVRGIPGFLLVLGSANVDEALRGYMTKYDCSSADINPIGGISKVDLKRFLLWAADNIGYKELTNVVEAPPTAELEPITENYTQLDEVDMGMSYQELSVFGRLRKLYRCGPVSMYERLRHTWNHLSPLVVAEKVKRFFYYYSVNRHKMTVLTPSYHAESYSPDDNRFDLRQFLYNTTWTRQFNNIDTMASNDHQKKSNL
jgi:NAD+ synthase (glutamine-hydrolysing)